MSIFQLIGIALGGAITALLVKQINPHFSVYVSIITAIILTYSAFLFFSPLVTYALELSERGAVESYASVILRVTAIGAVTKLACEICSDAGENAIGGRIELLGKGAIAASVLPVLKTIIESAENFLT